MTLQNIDIDHLTISPLNVRKHGAKEVAGLAASIGAIGLLQPLLVRENEDGSFEVIAGQRRLHALRQLAEAKAEAVEATVRHDIPCLVMKPGDDAAAIEASLAENIERLPMDEVDQFKAFAKLTKEGRSVEDIAASFGITEQLVEQRLALGRLYGPILNAYRKGDIQARDIRILTRATAKQQKSWWALLKDEDAYLPTGPSPKSWLFGGAHIPVSHAVFDVAASGLAIITDLFGEEACFADAEAFWTHQDEAIHMLAACYEASGWAEAVTLERGAHFVPWQHRACSKANGGKVFITVSHRGEVEEHEGYITEVEAKRRERAARKDAGLDQAKPELSKPAQNYVALHRHAAVRADLIGETGIALRLIAAHMIAGSLLWQVAGDRLTAAKDSIAESLAANAGHQAVNAERAAITALLQLEESDYPLPSGCAYVPRPSITQVMERLGELSTDDVLRILTFLMIESLSIHSPLIDPLGAVLGTDVSKAWQPDATFFDLMRDKTILTQMVAEYAGEAAAEGNKDEPAKTQRSILNACADGMRQPAHANWVPRYMRFPASGYRENPTEREELAEQMREAEQPATEEQMVGEEAA